MLIPFGEQDITVEYDKGNFNCSVCNGQQSFSHQQVHCYFSMFFVKTFKLALKSNFVLCDRCGACYNPRVLQSPEKFQQPIDQAVLLRVLCYIIAGYGDTKYSRQRLIDIYYDQTQQTLKDLDITSEIININSGNSPTLPYIKNNQIFLSHKAKQVIVLASYKLASESCMMEFEDRVRINTIAANMDIELVEVEYLVASISTN
jgi:transcription elongation factor Elf1